MFTKYKGSSYQITICALSGVLVGCADFGLGQSEYSCSGIPSKVHCQSAREVYLSHQDTAIKPNLPNNLGVILSKESNDSFSVPILKLSDHIDSMSSTLDEILDDDLRNICERHNVMLIEVAPYIECGTVVHGGESFVLVMPQNKCNFGIDISNYGKHQLKESSHNELNNITQRYVPIPYEDKQHNSINGDSLKKSLLGLSK